MGFPASMMKPMRGRSNRNQVKYEGLVDTLNTKIKRRQTKMAQQGTSRRMAIVGALLLQFALIFNVMLPVFGSNDEKDVAQPASIGRKISPEVKALVRRYREDHQRDRLCVVIRTKGEPSAGLKNELLEIDESFGQESGSQNTNKIAGDIALDDVERIAARPDVVRISLDTRKRESETGLHFDRR